MTVYERNWMIAPRIGFRHENITDLTMCERVFFSYYMIHQYYAEELRSLG